MRPHAAAALSCFASAVRVSVAGVHAGGPPPPTPDGEAKDLQVSDDGDMSGWIGGFVDRAVADGRQSPEAAAYFRDILNDKPEFADCLREARRLTGGQDPAKFTPYQQGIFADRLGQYMSGVAAQKLMEVQQEEQQGKNFSKDGTPTGEQYWYEAGTTLASPAVPNYVKDEIFHDMQKDRRRDSPAFEVPAEAHRLAEKDDGFAAHLRQQRQSLFRGADFGPHGK